MNELKNKLNIDKLRQLPWKRIALIGAPCLLIVVLALVFSLVTNKPAPTQKNTTETNTPSTMLKILEAFADLIESQLK